MVSPQKKADLVQVITRALPNGNHLCARWDVDTDDEAVRLTWWDTPLRVNVDMLAVTELDAHGLRFTSKISMLAEELIRREVRRHGTPN